MRMAVNLQDFMCDFLDRVGFELGIANTRNEFFQKGALDRLLSASVRLATGTQRQLIRVSPTNRSKTMAEDGQYRLRCLPPEQTTQSLANWFHKHNNFFFCKSNPADALRTQDGVRSDRHTPSLTHMNEKHEPTLVASAHTKPCRLLIKSSITHKACAVLRCTPEGNS